MSDTPKVYAAINGVCADLVEVGIGKDGRNQQQGFFFRGIDQVYNTLGPILANRKLAILPRVTERYCEARKTAKGGTMYSVTLHVEFDLVSCEDGSKHTISSYGEAMDSGDKATNKAMSAAYKYAAFTAFCIPIQGQEDADNETPPPTEPVDDKPKTQPQQKPSAMANEELAELAVELDQAEDDKAARAVGGKIYKERERIDTARLKEISVNLMAKRCELCVDKEFDSVKRMAQAFTEAGILTEKETKPLISGAASRLNLEQ